jgi:hypothetical protein
MVNGSRSRDRTEPTTMALLQYEKSASHMKAIKYFTYDNQITFNGKILKFIPAGFTNDDECPAWIDYSEQRYRANMGNIPLITYRCW